MGSKGRTPGANRVSGGGKSAGWTGNCWAERNCSGQGDVSCRIV